MAKNRPKRGRLRRAPRKRGAGQADFSEPNAAEAAPPEPEAAQAGVSEPEAAQADVPEPEAAKADVSEPEAAQGNMMPEPEATQWDFEVHQHGNRLARAFRTFREGLGREAADLYHDIVQPRETPLMAHVNRGIRHDEHGRHELAVEEFLGAKALDAENVENLAHLATAYGALSRFVEADVVIERAARLDSGNVEVRVAGAILAFRKGLYNTAEVQLKGICEGHPTHGPAHFYRGEALNRLGRVDEALETMERTIQLQPGNWRAYHTLGVLFDRKNDRERASEMYRHARELNRL